MIKVLPHEPPKDPNTPNIILLVASILVGWYSALKTTNHTWALIQVLAARRNTTPIKSLKFEGHPAHLFYFKGLAKLGASWIATLYPTSSKEILLIKIIGAQLCWGKEEHLAMDNNSSVPDPFNGPAYQLLSKVSSHPLAQVINVNLQTSFKTFLSPRTQLSLIA